MAKPETTTKTPPAAPAPPAEAKPIAKAVAAAPPARSVTPLILARWSEAQFTQARHAVRPEANTRYADLLDPAYWAHLAPKILANDVIEVRPAEGGYYAELYVWAKGPNWLQVSELRKIERPQHSARASGSKAFSIDFVDGPAKHRVIRTSDQQVVAQHFDSPEAANAWLGENAGRIAA
jgi:hypothetical protein